MASFFMMPLRAKGNQSPGQSLEEVIAKHWRDVFEAFQLEDEEDGSVRAHKVAKEMQLMGLNHGVSNLCIDEDKDNQDASNILSDLMVQTYVPACLSVVAAEQVDDLDVKKRLLDFMAKVAIQLGNTHRHKMIQLATDASLALSDPVRALACFLLGQLSATEALIPRLTDKSIAVRFAAISATQHVLKSSEDFALLEALLWNVWHEPSVPNRVAAVQALPAKDDIWDHVIARLRDVKEKVRVAALQGLHQTQSLEQLTSSQMAEILQSGMGLEAR